MTAGSAAVARSAQLDIARFILMVLVVAGHMFEQYGTGIFDWSYRFLYLFHMPAFAFLSGMVARNVVDGRAAHRLVFGIAAVYLLHQLLLQLLDAHLFGHRFVYNLDRPYWILWYLMSLLWWRLSLPMLLVFRWPVMVACVLAVLAGLAPYFGYTWSVSRTLVFLPFFVAGHVWARGHGVKT